MTKHCDTCTCGCTCGYGGHHEPENPRCDLNAPPPGVDTCPWCNYPDKGVRPLRYEFAVPCANPFHEVTP